MLVHLGEPSLFRFYELDKINASLIPLLFKSFVKFDIAYSPPPSRWHMCPFKRSTSPSLITTLVISKKETYNRSVKISITYALSEEDLVGSTPPMALHLRDQPESVTDSHQSPHNSTTMWNPHEITREAIKALSRQALDLHLIYGYEQEEEVGPLSLVRFGRRGHRGDGRVAGVRRRLGPYLLLSYFYNEWVSDGRGFGVHPIFSSPLKYSSLKIH
jgi:hypothetical protein